VVKELKEHPEMSFSDVDLSTTSAEECERYSTALQADPIGKGRSIVTSLRSSGQRRADFLTTIKEGNTEGIWKLRPVQLLRDIDVRWSSLYGMVGRVLELYEVFLSPFTFGCSR
jgi:hypothetical protein